MSYDPISGMEYNTEKQFQELRSENRRLRAELAEANLAARQWKEAFERTMADYYTVRAEVEALRAALVELVALKDLKERIRNYEFGGTQEIAAASEDYETRKPKAWEAARVALDAARGE